MMTRTKITFGTALPALLLILGIPAPGQAETDFTGQFLVGYRSVDVGGQVNKFKEDLNLDDGPRLFDFGFDLKSTDGLGGFADRVTLNTSNLGGDPFETFSLGIRKYGSYRFTYDRRESIYFYQDIILPADQASASSATGGDFHHFDFERVRDSAELKIDLTQAAELTFGFDRFTKRGESTTSLDVSREEFELDKPVEETQDTYSVGLTYAWDKVTLVVEERFRDYENVVDIFLPGASEGAEPEEPTALDFYFLDQPYDYDANTHNVRVMARPTEDLDIRGSVTIEDLSLDVSASESAQGTSFSGAPLNISNTGSGEIDRDMELYDFEITYLITDRFGIVGSVYQHNLDQEGDMAFGTDLNIGQWDIETTGAEAGVKWVPRSTLSVTGGLSYESRDVDFAWSQDGEDHGESESTDNDGYFVTVAWEPVDGLDLTGDFEVNSFDDPFTLASPTDRSRHRVRAKYRWGDGFFASGSYQLVDYENDNSGWEADTEKITARFGYDGRDLDVSVGYSLVEMERSIDQIVNDDNLFAIFYLAESDFLDGRVRWRATDRVAIGGSFRLYENDGSFALEHEDFRGFVEVGFGEGYLASVAFRTVDYDEAAFDFDDYDADIAELSIGYRW